MNILKALFWLLFSTFILGCNQKKEVDQFDTYISKSKYYYDHYDAIKSIEYGKLAYDLAKKNNDKEKIAESCMRLSIAASTIGLYKEALNYNKEGFENCPNSDFILKNYLKEGKAYTLTQMGFYKEAINIYSEIDKELKNKIDNSEAVITLANSYINTDVIYYTYLGVDSSAVYLEKLDKLFKTTKVPEKEIFKVLCEFHFYKGQIMLDNPEKLDSANILFIKSIQTKKMYRDSVLYKDYAGLAGYWEIKKNPEKALKYYLKAIENIEGKNVENEVVYLYKKVAEIYKYEGASNKALDYYKKYNAKNEEIKSNEKKNVESAMKHLLEEKTKKQSSVSYKLLVLSISLIVIILIVVSYFRIERKKNLELLEKKEDEVEILQVKINESFDEIIQMAKENQPEFYTRFKEVYPDFNKRFLEKNDKLTIAELTLAAYIYLGFTTKEIADLTFRSVKTIESTRYNLRKKLKLPYDVNLQSYITNTINN